jgi:aminopeptidase
MDNSALQILARVLVTYSLDVRPGEVVVISGATVSEPLLLTLFAQVLEVGGLPVVRLTAEVSHQTRLNFSGSDHIRYLNPLGLAEGCAIDCSIGIWSKSLSKNRRGLAHFAESSEQNVPVPLLPDGSWIGSKSDEATPDKSQSCAQRQPEDESPFESDPCELGAQLRWVATEYPTEAAARAAGMSLVEYEDCLLRAGRLDSADPVAAWREVHDRQQRVCDYLQKADELRLVTPQGTDLTVGIAGRPWFNSDGHYNFPDGEVCTAPIAEAVDGVIYSSFPVVHESEVIEGIRLQVEGGQVVDAGARRGEQHLFKLLDKDAGARRLGEVALGTNFAVTRYLGSLLLDEKMGGTFHIALGAAYPQMGGGNQSAIHCDIVGDLHQGGRVEADGRVISRNGRFLNPAWPCP